MKRNKTDHFDEWLAEALAEAEDKEAEEFMSMENDDVEISEELDRRIQNLMEQKSKKEIFQAKYYPKILSSAALVTFVTICFAWVAMMSTFVKFPWNDTEPPILPTDTLESVSGSFSDQTYVPPGQESTVITRPPESSPSSGNHGRPTESTNRGQQGSVGQTSELRNPSKGIYTAPSDEQKAFYIITQGNRAGVFLTISIAGYQSENIGKEFYVKSNEYFIVTVEVKNISASPIYRPVETDCSPDDPPHTHSVSLNLSSDYQNLCSSVIGFDCGGERVAEILKSGETHTYQLKYAAGEVVAGGFDLPGDGNDYPAGIKLYDTTFQPFAKGSCTFTGNLSFDYKKDEKNNWVSFSVPLSLEVLYVEP
ncbi:MAG: hypothetical protein IJD59_02260 [Clostridia bacterium]|nr:hypothetical protein [Clostridia bacterium]